MLRTITAIGLALCFQASAQAQEEARTASVRCEPASHELDAVSAAPASHRVVFEDEHVRVLDIVLPPLAVEPIHVHALPSVITGDTGGADGARFMYTTYELANGEWKVIESHEITPTPGRRTVWSPPEGPHSIANIGPVPVRFNRIEIKPESCAAGR